ncbi:MAG: hypothetical protein R3263_10105, partial [Myxococcota bacterium]|nr:hypothetical protein [Myxococcota bacterium]
MDDPGNPPASSPSPSSGAEPVPAASPPSAEAAASGPRVGRRALVAGGLGAVVASALTRLETAHAQDDVPPPQAPLLLGTDNVAFDTTALLQDGPGPTLQVENLDSGLGIRVLSNKGPALQAQSSGAGVVGVGGPLSTQGPVTLTATLPAVPSTAGVLGASRHVGV